MTPIPYRYTFELASRGFLPELLVDGSTVDRWFYWADKECRWHPQPSQR